VHTEFSFTIFNDKVSKWSIHIETQIEETRAWLPVTVHG